MMLGGVLHPLLVAPSSSAATSPGGFTRRFPLEADVL